MQNMKYLILIPLLLVACNDSDKGIQESKNKMNHNEESATDQIMARVVADPYENGRLYKVTITNNGSVPFCVSSLVRQQWCKISSEGDVSWEEQTKRYAHSHDNPTLASGDSFTTLVEPWTRSDMSLRFGFVTSGLAENSKRLIVWSGSVNPTKDWPKYTK